MHDATVRLTLDVWHVASRVKWVLRHSVYALNPIYLCWEFGTTIYILTLNRRSADCFI